MGAKEQTRAARKQASGTRRQATWAKKGKAEWRFRREERTMMWVWKRKLSCARCREEQSFP